MVRPTDDIGTVILDLDEATRDPASAANIVLLPGDTIFVPRRQDIVTIYTENTLADRLGRDSVRVGKKLQVAYRGEKNAKWYIDNFAGGFNGETARRRWTTVEYANGGIRETDKFLWINNYPTVRPGATIRVGTAPPKVRRERREERFDWIGLASVIVGAATTIATFILLRRDPNPN